MAFTRTSQPNFIIKLALAIFLAVCVTTGTQAEKFTAKFTTTPKNKEAFVGDSVEFDWDYNDVDNQVNRIKFGVSLGKTLQTVVWKGPGENTMAYYHDVRSDMGSRTKVVQQRRASFRIENVRMNDTGVYFCTLYSKPNMMTLTDHVQMRVVDLQIDDKASKTTVESWQNQKISLTCMVRVPENTPVEFTWQQQPSNRTLSRGLHIDTETESILKLLTSDDKHFTTYTCIAKTKKTTKMHSVFVKRLLVPGPPENLQSQMIFKKGESYPKVFWSKPKSDGGAKITGYIIEYKPERISWDKATRARTKSTEYTKLNIKEGKTYNVRVIARNKVDEGPSSNEVTVKLDAYPAKKGSRSNVCAELRITWWLLLLSLAMLLKSQVPYEWL